MHSIPGQQKFYGGFRYEALCFINGGFRYVYMCLVPIQEVHSQTFTGGGTPHELMLLNSAQITLFRYTLTWIRTWQSCANQITCCQDTFSFSCQWSAYKNSQKIVEYHNYGGSHDPVGQSCCKNCIVLRNTSRYFNILKPTWNWPTPRMHLLLALLN